MTRFSAIPLTLALIVLGVVRMDAQDEPAVTPKTTPETTEVIPGSPVPVLQATDEKPIVPAPDGDAASIPGPINPIREIPDLTSQGLPPVPSLPYIESKDIAISWSEKGDAVWGLSKSVRKWVKQEIQPIAEDDVFPLINGNVATLQVGNVIYAYCGQTGRWDILRLPTDRVPQMSGDANTLVFTDGNNVYTFARATGGWSSPDATVPETSKTDKSSGELTIFSLKYADAQSMCAILNQLFFRPNSPGVVGDVTITPDQRLNAIIVTGSQEDLSKLEAVVKRLDQPRPDRPPGPSPVDAYRAMREGTRAKAQPQPATLRQNYNQLEQQAAHLAEQYRDLPLKATRAPGDAQAVKRQLTDVANQAFEARQKLQRAELDELRQRLARIEQQIAARERIKDAIIDRRVEELLDPHLRWEPADKKITSPPTSAMAQPRSKPDAQAQQLLDIAQQRWEILIEQYRAGIAKSGELLAAATELLEARRGVPRSPEARQTPLQDHIAALKDLHEMVKTQHEVGRTPLADVLMVQSALLKAERQIAAEKPKSPTPSVADPGGGQPVPSPRPARNPSNAEPQPAESGDEKDLPTARSSLEVIRQLEAELEALSEKYAPQHAKVRELESRLENLHNHRAAESLPTSALILHSAGDFRRKLNEAEAELKHVIQLEERGYVAASEVESSRRQLATIREEYAAQIRLLELELKEAELSADTAQKKYANTLALRGAVPEARVTELRRDAQTAAIDVERAKTLLELYRKVGQNEQSQLEPVDEGFRAGGAKVENPAK